MNEREKVIVELNDSIEILESLATDKYTIAEMVNLCGSVTEAVKDAIEQIQEQEIIIRAMMGEYGDSCDVSRCDNDV